MLDRRGFLKFIGGAAVGTLATPVIWQGLDDLSIWSQNWPWIPHLEYGNNDNTYVRTVSKMCPSAVGTRVRLVGGRPVRVLGDPDSPLGGGGVSALAVAEIQMRYSPDRLKRPLKRASDGSYREISWEEAERTLLTKLTSAKGKNGIVTISGDENGSMNELLSGLTRQMGSEQFFLMPGDAQSTARAWKCLGGKGRVGYDIPASDFVLAVGANVLETWGPIVSNRHAWGDARPFGQEPAMRIAYAGPAENNTAVGADLWVPIKPGTEAWFLLGVANQLIRTGAAAPAPGLDAFKAAVAPWTPEKIAEITGITPETITMVASQLKAAKAPVVVVGSDSDLGAGVIPTMLGMTINLLLDRLNKPGGMRALPVSPPVIPDALVYEDLYNGDLLQFAENIAKGGHPDIKTLIVYEANPIYALPGKGIDALFKKSEFSVAFTTFFDETAHRCDLVLPAALGLERYDDVAYPFAYGKSIYTLAQPVAEPLFEARPVGELLIALAGHLPGWRPAVSDIPEMLKAKAASVGADWNDLLNGNAFESDDVLNVPTAGYHIQPAMWKALQTPPVAPGSGELAITLVGRRSLGTPKTAIPPSNTKTISPDELVNNLLVALVNGATLKKLRLYRGDRIKLTSPNGSVIAKIHAFEGVANDTVALTPGFGHSAFGEFNAGKGMNVMALAALVTEPGCPGLTLLAGTRVTVAKA